jgi:hypothetical protein
LLRFQERTQDRPTHRRKIKIVIPPHDWRLGLDEREGGREGGRES